MTVLSKLKFFWTGEVDPEKKNVYKIDCVTKELNSNCIYALYVKRSGGWYVVGLFHTKERAAAFYDVIKDLPEYLK